MCVKFFLLFIWKRAKQYIKSYCWLLQQLKSILHTVHTQWTHCALCLCIQHTRHKTCWRRGVLTVSLIPLDNNEHRPVVIHSFVALCFFFMCIIIQIIIKMNHSFSALFNIFDISSTFAAHFSKGIKFSTTQNNI